MGRAAGLLLPALYAIAFAAGVTWYIRHRKDL